MATQHPTIRELHEAISTYKQSPNETNFNCIAAILDLAPETINSRNEGFTPLGRAALIGNIDLLTLFVNKGADVNLLGSDIGSGRTVCDILSDYVFNQRVDTHELQQMIEREEALPLNVLELYNQLVNPENYGGEVTSHLDVTGAN